jgi:two-component system sensor histidine kinase HydH
MPRRNSIYKILLVSGLVLLISIFHYITRINSVFYNYFYLDLYFLPLVIASLWFGLKGALFTSFAISMLYLPIIVITWGGFSFNDFDQLLEIVLFYIISTTLGFLSNQQKANQKALQESKTLAALGQVVSGIAHDLKTPLIAIGGYSRSIKKKIGKDDPNRVKLDIIIQEAEKLENMTRDMLDFSRPLHLQKSPRDLNSLIRQLVIMEKTAQDHNVSLELLLADNLPMLFFDPIEMERVLSNLINNAIQASPEREKVVVRTYLKNKKVIVEVADNGPGIPPEIREKIFSPFFTTKINGTGLGLSIVLKIVQEHGGNIAVLANGEKGAIFKVTLPFNQ